MTPEFEPVEPELDQAIEQIHLESIDDAIVEAAAVRVWAKMQSEVKPAQAIRGCADFQALMPDYRAGLLDEGRALLLKDHTHECVACRKALGALSSRVVEIRPVSKPVSSWRSKPAIRWSIAAALVLGVGYGTWNVVLNLPNSARAEATVQASTGTLYRMSKDVMVPLHAGETLPAGAQVLTAKDSTAIVRLADGSQVEMRERSGFSINATFRDTTIRLGRGAVIVEAAKQHNGHLYVSTGDLRVSVIGTVFGVATGVKGSRVSVVEGEVHVAQNTREAVLHSGDQYTSTSAITPMAVAEDIAWSSKVDQHLALLKEFASLSKELARVPMPEVRYSSRLLGSVPPNTAFFLSIPNLGKTVGEASAILQTRIQESPALRQWWQQMEGATGGHRVEQFLDEIRVASEYLGDEILLVAPMDQNGRRATPVLMAEVKRPGLREFLSAEASRLHGSVVFAENAAGIQQPSKDVQVVLLTADFVAMSPDPESLRQVAQARENGTTFVSSSFGTRLTEAYRDGAGILVSADMESLTSREPKALEPGAAMVMGGVKQVLLEQKESQGQTNTRATFQFAGQRAGIASWLAQPASINALEYVSPEASALGAFVLKSPTSIIDEFLSIASAKDPTLMPHLIETESRVGVSFRDDLAATMGAEVALALDGPAFPTPSWKLVIEVYDPVRLQSALTRIVAAANVQSTLQGQAALTMTEDTVDGRTYYRISSPLLAKMGDINYVFSGGYLVAAPSRALLDQALSYRANRTGIAHSAKFAALIPADHYANFSGLIYHDLGSTVGVLVDASSSSSALTPEQRKTIQSLSADMKPMLIGVYAEGDRVTVATTSSALSLSAANLLALQGPAGIAEMITSRAAGPRRR
ncbi:MAG: FecR domain-containing protein [Bryobacteraceae bacterium]